MAAKVAVIGSIQGNFSSIISKLTKLHSKTQFDLAILVGNTFADPSSASLEAEKDLLSLLYGTITFPFPTYFSLGTLSLPEKVIERLDENDGELAENLFFLGKRTTTKTADGIRIVSLGGALDPKIVAGLSDKEDRYLPFHTEGDAKSLSGVVNPDLLITSTWPAGIRTNSTLKSDGEDPSSENGVAQLCALSRPKYHFSSSDDMFFEREPFLHPASEPNQTTKFTTRFMSVASPNSATKAKWLYAFNLHLNSAPPTTVPNGTTETPFSVKMKRERTEGLMFGRFSSAGSSVPERKSKRQKRTKDVAGPQECFFCLSNDSLATHMLVSIGEESYLATAKGPLSTSDQYPMKCPSHILIIPHAHRPTLASIEPSEREKTFAEMEKYRSALHSMLAVKARDFGAVTWEVSKADGVHIHWQWMPVPKSLIDKGLVEAGYQVEAENLEYPAFERRDVGDGSVEGGDFFRVRVWRSAAEKLEKANGENGESNGGTKEEKDSDENEIQLVLPLTGEHKFDMQFGRRVLAKLLGLESRLRWQDCAQDEEEETADAETFKGVFGEYDFAG